VPIVGYPKINSQKWRITKQVAACQSNQQVPVLSFYRKTKVKFLTKKFFNSSDSNIQLHGAANRLPYASREIPDFMTHTMDEISKMHNLDCIHVPHWHQLGIDEDSRTLRNILRSNDNGLPALHSRQLDLLNYMSMCLQQVDKQYAEYVKTWCYQQIMCLDEED
jgi:hypothetical protein